MEIIVNGECSICSTKHRLKGFTPGQLFFGQKMIPLIKHIANWKLICHQKQDQIIKDNDHKNASILEYDDQVVDKFTQKITL